MTTPKIDIEQLKAAALAATPVDMDLYGDRYSQGYWSRADFTHEQDVFYRAANPATMRELIAEVEHLRSMGSAEPVKQWRTKGAAAWVDLDMEDSSYGKESKHFEYRTLYTAPPAPVSAESVQKELESMTRMFNAACVDLGLINEALGLDPDDGGAEPILDAIEELKAKLARLPADWEIDSSLETWFPISAARLAQLESLAPPTTDAKDSDFISEDDFSLLFEFNEQAQDSEAGGYDASKEQMKRLAELGVVQSLGFGRYGVTSFGSWLIEKRFEQDTRLPLRTSAEHEKREHDAWQAYCDQMKAGDIAWINLPGDVQHQWRERAAIAAKEAAK